VSSIKRDSTRSLSQRCENFLYGFKGAPLARRAARVEPDGIQPTPNIRSERQLGRLPMSANATGPVRRS